MHSDDFRNIAPRYSADNRKANHVLVGPLGILATEYKAAPADSARAQHDPFDVRR